MQRLKALYILNPRHQKRYVLAALLLYLCILVLGSVPGARQEVGQVASGLVLHIVTYSVLTILLFIGAGGSAAQRALKAVLSVMAMGIGDEWIQHFLPYRSGTVLDWTVDLAAATSTAILLWIIWPTVSAHDSALTASDAGRWS